MRVFFFKNHEKVKEDIWSGWYLCSTERGGSWNELPVSGLSFLAFLFRILEKEAPQEKMYIFEQCPPIPPIWTAWSSFFGVIIARKVPRYFPVHISIYWQSRFGISTLSQFNSIQSLFDSRCFRDLGANMPGVVNCQGNGETISFFGKRGFKVFQVAGNHLIINYPCLSPGNYPSYQTSNGREWCTDPQTGWRVKFIFFVWLGLSQPTAGKA